MKNLIIHNPIVNWFGEKILLIRYIRHYYYMKFYLTEWAAVEGKTLEQFKKDTFQSEDENFIDFMRKFDYDDFEKFKKENSFFKLLYNSKQ